MKRVFALALALVLLLALVPIVVNAGTLYDFCEEKLGETWGQSELSTDMPTNISGIICDSGMILGLIEDGKFYGWAGPVKNIGPVFIEALNKDKAVASYFWDFVFGDYDGYTEDGATHFFYDWDPNGILDTFLEENVSYSLPFENKEDYLEVISFSLFINEDWEGCGK